VGVVLSPTLRQAEKVSRAVNAKATSAAPVFFPKRFIGKFPLHYLADNFLYKQAEAEILRRFDTRIINTNVNACIFHAINC
jgi:hypothetical protein